VAQPRESRLDVGLDEAPVPGELDGGQETLAGGTRGLAGRAGSGRGHDGLEVEALVSARD